ncbi:hypothetical protein Naga_100281g8 [Nannochloropsis gaditana]|uniref:Uncharacterized protein n=1 Tax=Nannochloropsis gaditana TaxID=72520 RepID=W7TGT5_9STRA|nr:hypothetical protein Naga_100281g8 [Nannochloropsis gaditana]
MRFHVIALLIGAVTACHAAESEKKGGPMQRVKRMMATDATAATATSAGEEEDIQDSWSFDSVLSGARRLINGDHAGILADMSMGKEMQEIFENPEVSYQLLQVFPMFKVLNGVKELSAKPKELFTKADSLSVLESYRNFVSTAIKNMKDMADPVGMATTMQKYSDAMSPVTQNPDGSHRALTEEERRMTELVRRVEVRI